jgi:membrane protein DedA with SNARE-associated domain
VPFWRFALLDGIAALISVPLWVHLGYQGANNRQWLMTWVTRSRSGILAAVAVALLVMVVIARVRRARAAIAADPPAPLTSSDPAGTCGCDHDPAPPVRAVG